MTCLIYSLHGRLHIKIKYVITFVTTLLLSKTEPPTAQVNWPDRSNFTAVPLNKSKKLTYSVLEKLRLPSPVDSILEAVFTVSPNKQYRGILDPTMPATTGPVWAPHLICKVSDFWWGILNWVEPANRSRAMLAISLTCLLPASVWKKYGEN